ncbi:MAG: DUF1552 domain-containing protein [Bryobacterales bacterium]|nr:DUF1552 domain-containing protein [Bryobacterales bacterium]
MLLISNNLGVLPDQFFPMEAGADFRMSPYLQSLEEHREDFTVFSGLSHPGVRGGHSTENCFLTAAKGPTRSGFRNQISLDQVAAETVGHLTRFPTLNLGVNIVKSFRSLSWTRGGALLPAEDKASAVFRKMFVQGSREETQQRLHELRTGGSILDAVETDMHQFASRFGKDDRHRLDQYFTSVRALEQRLLVAGEWENRPKPKIDQEPPKDPASNAEFFDKYRSMLSMAKLALESDSTRIVTIMVDAFATNRFELADGELTTDGYHNLSHHGRAAEKVRQLEEADRRQMALLGELVKELAVSNDGSGRLLDNTMLLFGSNMGDANTHDNTNLPILLVGGGFRHGQHLAFNRDANTPLCNLFVSMLQRMDVEVDAFGSSTGSLAGLSFRG